jgi:hypothetical protein
MRPWPTGGCRAMNKELLGYSYLKLIEAVKMIVFNCRFYDKLLYFSYPV